MVQLITYAHTPMRSNAAPSFPAGNNMLMCKVQHTPMQASRTHTTIKKQQGRRLLAGVPEKEGRGELCVLLPAALPRLPAVLAVLCDTGLDSPLLLRAVERLAAAAASAAAA
eukprot:373821-Pelagomonas_calceolata.AAC.1